MPDLKITGLTADASPTSDDLIPTVTDPAGTPANRKVTLANAITKAHGLSDGIVKVATGTMAAATAGTDYVAPGGALGTPSSGVATNLTGTAAGLTAGTVTTNANLTGVVTSTGNATAIADAALSIAKTSGLQAALDAKQASDADLTTIAGLTATTDNFIQSKASAWASRTPTQVTADLIAMVGDSGAGGTKGLVPAPATGDASKFLKGDATWAAIPGGGDALVANPLSQFAATTSLQLKNTISDETGSGALVFADTPTLIAPILGTPTSGVATNLTGTATGLTSGITNALKSATTTVDVSAATAPSSGQVLTATSGTAATWQTPSGGTGGLATTSASVTTADVTGVVGTLHYLDLSGLTAARNFTLPATAAIDDRVGVYVSAGCTTSTRELIIKANTGDTLNGVSAAEWSRVFITGECVIMRCVVANTTWVVEHDGRRVSTASLTRTTVQALTSGVFNKVNVATSEFSVGDVGDTTNSRIYARRAGRYLCGAFCRLDLADGKSIVVGLAVNGTVLSRGQGMSSLSSGVIGSSALAPLIMAAGDYLEVHVYHDKGSDNNTSTISDSIPRVYFNEIL